MRNTRLDRFVDPRAFRSRPPEHPLRHFTSEQIAAYDRDGFLLLRAVLDPGFVERLRAEAMKLFARNSRSVKNIERHSDIFRAVYEPPPIRGMIEDLNGPSVMCQSFVFFKQPGERRPKPWHQDSIYWGTSAETMVNVFVPLTQAVARNGAVHFVPGSHRLGRLFHWVEDDGFGFPNLVCDVSAFREPVVPEVSPGDIIISHNLVVHASFANESDEMRINLGFHHHAVGTTLDWLDR
jgi:ectoine hydroxylase-related dioxygenase (phytanoyl-CoA dioxygenase family)